MIHNDIQNQLQLLIKGTAQPLLEVARSPVETPEWTVGQRLPAVVLASLPNGRFQVQIENQVLDMNLPRNTQPGETLELTYIGNTPRLTFALTSEQPAALVQYAPVSLSEAAKLVDGLVQKTAQEPAQAATLNKSQPESAQASALSKSQPVLSTPPGEGKPLAEALRNTLSQGGLFYESHQAQWVTGERPLTILMQEPQAQLTPLAMQPQAQSAPLTAAQQQAVAVPPATQNDVARNPDAVALRVSDVGLQQSTGRIADASSSPVHPQALPLIQQQLGVLDSRQIVWQGQVWPGQEMRWEIEEDGNSHHGEQDAPVAWKTRLSLQLPRMGGVTANIALAGDGVRIDFSVDQTDSAALLKREQTRLAQSLAAAGLSLTGVTVNQNEHVEQT